MTNKAEDVCKGDLSIGSGCKRCARCAQQFEDRIAQLKAERDEARAQLAQRQVQAEPVTDGYPHEQMDALALSRYKVVPSDQSMYWRHAVVAGDGQQHLYNGSEVDCQNLARKFAGAFLDGAFAFHSLYTPPAPPHREPLTDEQITAALIAWFGHDLVIREQAYRDAMRNAIEAAAEIKGEDDGNQ